MSGGRAIHRPIRPLIRFALSRPAAPSYTESAVTRRTAIALLAAALLNGQGNSWNKLRYSGGTVQAKVNPFDWNSTLTINPDSLVFTFGPRVTLRLQPAQVTTVSYGQEAHRRVGDMVALSVVATPLALFGILHKSKTHFIGVEYRDGAGQPGAVLLEADKNNYRAIVKVLEAVTGKPVKNAP
jgi:hypothetical protein